MTTFRPIVIWDEVSFLFYWLCKLAFKVITSLIRVATRSKDVSSLQRG